MNVHVVRSRVAVLMLSFAVGACNAGESGSEGGLELRLKDEATAADAGLPTYPGAKPYTDGDESGNAANLRLSTAAFGFKVVALDLETSDKPERVAAFYRKALSKYGNVLECSGGADRRRESERGVKRTGELECDEDDAGSHSLVYKVGTEQNQRIVAIKPHGGGTRFSLVHLDIRD